MFPCRFPFPYSRYRYEKKHFKTLSEHTEANIFMKCSPTHWQWACGRTYLRRLSPVPGQCLVPPVSFCRVSRFILSPFGAMYLRPSSSFRHVSLFLLSPFSACLDISRLRSAGVCFSRLLRHRLTRRPRANRTHGVPGRPPPTPSDAAGDNRDSTRPTPVTSGARLDRVRV